MASSEPSLVRPRPGLLDRAFFKVLVLAYHGPIADLFRSRCVMLLTTVGRRSGLPRTTGVSFMPVADHFVVFSGWGIGSNWYRNVRANPTVTLKVGRRRFHATARVVSDPARRRSLMLEMQKRSPGCGPPREIRPLLRLIRVFDYQAEIDMAVAAGSSLPVVEIVVDR